MEDRPIFQLSQGRTEQLTTFDPATGDKTVFVAPGERKTIFYLEGRGMIARFWMTLPGWFWRYWDPDAAVDPTVLRLTILRLYFDGCPEPSVEGPVGDFFGVGHCEFQHYTSRYLGMSSGGFYCYFPMPFDRGFRLEVENLHQQETAELFFNITWQRLERLPEQSGRFHCAFRAGENAGGDPLETANIQGQGHLAGCALSIQGSVPNNLAFLEAPEYIWVDGEEPPALVGTGLEDYFNGGWYFRDGPFCAESHGVPLKDPLRSMISMYRFHDGDRVNFQRSLRMCFLNPWKKERLKPFRYSSTVYYYLSEASPACFRIPPAKDLLCLYRVRDRDFQAIP